MGSVGENTTGDLMKIYTLTWQGPFFDLEQIRSDKSLYHGIYAFVGIKKHKRNDYDNIKLQYIGKTNNQLYTRLKQHHKLPTINRELSIWFGKVTNTRNYNLENIEHIFISFALESELINEKKIKSYPSFDCTVVSQFIKSDNEKYSRLPRALRSIPEVIVWDSDKKILRYVRRLHIIDNPKGIKE